MFSSLVLEMVLCFWSFPVSAWPILPSASSFLSNLDGSESCLGGFCPDRDGGLGKDRLVGSGLDTPRVDRCGGVSDTLTISSHNGDWVLSDPRSVLLVCCNRPGRGSSRPSVSLSLTFSSSLVVVVAVAVLVGPLLVAVVAVAVAVVVAMMASLL